MSWLRSCHRASLSNSYSPSLAIGTQPIEFIAISWLSMAGCEGPYVFCLADVHAFLFESDGTYVDCVFYKNPTLAGKSVRLLQEQQELLVDLRYLPKRCSFIVCTLAIYSGGTVAQLGNGTVKVSPTNTGA